MKAKLYLPAEFVSSRRSIAGRLSWTSAIRSCAIRSGPPREPFL
jgi:hypothetical protein